MSLPKYKIALCIYLNLVLWLSACGGKTFPTPTPTPKLPNIKAITDDITLTQKLQELKTRNPALSSALNEFIIVYQQSGKEAALALARERNILDKADNIPVTIILDTQEVTIIRELSQKAEVHGCITRGYLANELELLVPLSILETYDNPDAQQTLLDELAALAHVQNIKLTDFMMPQGRTIEGEGVKVTGADKWHEQGYRGRGVKVGILDYGFAGYHDLLGSELPDVVITQSFDLYEEIAEGSNPHGTAVAEIIHEVAPEAELYLAQIDGSGSSFRRGSLWLAEQGVQIINHSGGFPDGPFDGTCSQDEFINEIVARGILWVNSAGNDGAAHWRGMFEDSDGDGLHNFTDEANFIPIEGERGVQLHWWGNPEEDYDVYVIDEFENVVASSLDDQKSGIPPREVTNRFIPLPGIMYYAAIKAEQEAIPVMLDLFVTNGEILYTGAVVPERSIINPGTAHTALTVGATYWQNDEIEEYSSRGPTSDGRLKPELSAPARVRDVSYRQFSGTSAAAPHVSGLAALVLNAYPDMTIDQLREYLIENAQDLGITGPDNAYGYGRVALPLQVARVVPSAIHPTRASSPTVVAIHRTAIPQTTPTTLVSPGSPTRVADKVAVVKLTRQIIMGTIAAAAILIMGFFIFQRTIHSHNQATIFPSPSTSHPIHSPVPQYNSPYLTTPDGQRYNLQSGVNLIGREATCSICVADPAMSRQHARLSVSNSRVVVEDTSTNGTFVNGQRITLPTPLHDSDKLRCGNAVFTFHFPSPQTTVPAILIAPDGTQYSLSKQITTIGREVPNDIVFSDAHISKTHAKVEKIGAVFWLIDMNSANGCFVNGQRVHNRQKLHSGDIIRLGKADFVFR